jgi:hypothetical protein
MSGTAACSSVSSAGVPALPVLYVTVIVVSHSCLSRGGVRGKRGLGDWRHVLDGRHVQVVWIASMPLLHVLYVTIIVLSRLCACCPQSRMRKEGLLAQCNAPSGQALAHSYTPRCPGFCSHVGKGG